MPPRFRGRSTPSYAWCRRSPPHPDSCPHLDRRRSHPSVPSRSSMEIPFRGSSDWLDTVTVSRGRASTTTTRRTKRGDFHRPPAGTATWPPVGTLSRPWTPPRTSKLRVEHTSLHRRCVPPTWLTAKLTWFAFSGCDDEHSQAQRRVGVRLSDPAGRGVGCHREGPCRTGLLLHRTRRKSGGLGLLWDRRH